MKKLRHCQPVSKKSFQVTTVCTFLIVVVMFPFGRLLMLYFSLVVPAICNFLLHICICFPNKINDDDDEEAVEETLQLSAPTSVLQSCSRPYCNRGNSKQMVELQLALICININYKHSD